MAVAAVAVAYGFTPIYRFPAARPFSGPRLYNPYAARAPETRWLKANLHAHAHAWGGLTNGRGSDMAVQERYRSMGYDLATVSNYHSVREPTDTNELVGYEQGYNVGKSHLLVVGARHVDWLDFPLIEGASQKQLRIDRLRRDGAITVVVHPELRNGFSMADLTKLTGFEALEVVSHFGDATSYWDAALTAGRLVWAVADDDSHNANDARQTGRAWTMIAADGSSRGAILDAIRAGRTYAVTGNAGRADVAVEAVRSSGDTIVVLTSGAPANITFIGRGGRTLISLPNVHGARFVLPPGEPYARAMVSSATTKLLLNPIVRTAGGSAGAPIPLAAVVDEFETGEMRLLTVLIALTAFVRQRRSPRHRDGTVVELRRAALPPKPDQADRDAA